MSYLLSGKENLATQRLILLMSFSFACLCFAACGANGGVSRGSTSGSGSTPGGSPVYVTNINGASVSAYLINTNSGALQTAAGSPFATGRSAPDSVTFDPAKKFLLVANSASLSTSVFSVNSSTAALTAVQGSPFTAAANEVRLAMHPGGKFLYGLSSTPAQIDGYNFNTATGALSSLSGFPVSLNGTGAMGLAVSPGGAFLYASNPNTNLITSFSVATGGALAFLATTTALNMPVFLTFDSSGRFLFAANSTGGTSGGGSVSVFAVSITGALTEVSGSPFAVGSTPVSAVFSSSTLYVVNQTSGTLSAFSVNDTTGQLTEIKGSPYPLGTRPVSVAAAVHGTLLLVTNSTSGNSGSISVFSVASDGTLTPVSGSPFVPDTATPDQVVAF